MWRTATTEWELLVRHDISNALPLTRPPLQLRRAVELGDGIYLCGDHQDTPSIQGAMASGHRTAVAVSRLLRLREQPGGADALNSLSDRGTDRAEGTRICTGRASEHESDDRAFVDATSVDAWPDAASAATRGRCGAV